MAKFIQRAIKHPGALRRQLGIKAGRKISSRALNTIAKAKIGSRVNIDRRVKVTRTLKRRAVLAKTLRRLR